jgi:hypothetical protein
LTQQSYALWSVFYAAILRHWAIILRGNPAPHWVMFYAAILRTLGHYSTRQSCAHWAIVLRSNPAPHWVMFYAAIQRLLAIILRGNPASSVTTCPCGSCRKGNRKSRILRFRRQQRSNIRKRKFSFKGLF